ncbi:MAG TPA: type IV toxin-antitoxin system AbiEi family antitoxin domain-containing protein [Solirubrobacterales bacterium]|nr:type IV toxin-antitoxin system AbiEi family antitoxin domain-containing protein [Solirubrobacterales bacterium]
MAAVAESQHGAISTGQLHRAGLSNAAVMRRVQAGRLHKLHRGVYAVGHMAPNKERRWMAAILALTSGADGSSRTAALSHRSAAALWELLPSRCGPVDVSLPSRGGRRRRQGIRIHRPTLLEPRELTIKRAIPVTSPARTLADLRSTVLDHELRRAIRQAEFLGLQVGPEIESDRTRSELERRFLQLCRRARFPDPAVNMAVGAMTVDFCWVRQKFVVETDGFQAHRGRQAFEDDRARDLRLRSHGYQVQHLSHRQVFQEPEWVVSVLQTALGARK